MVRNLSSLQTYQLKDMIERAPVYQKSSPFQKQLITNMNLKIISTNSNSTERPTTATSTNTPQTSRSFVSRHSIKEARAASITSSKANIPARKTQAQLLITASKALLTKQSSPPTSNNTSISENYKTIQPPLPLPLSSSLIKPQTRRHDPQPLPPQSSLNTAASSISKQPPLIKNLEKLNNHHRLIKVADGVAASKPVLKPVRKNSIILSIQTNKDLLQTQQKHQLLSSQSPNASLSPINSRPPSSSSPRTHFKAVKTKIDAVLTFKNGGNVSDLIVVRSRPSSSSKRNMIDKRRDSRGGSVITAQAPISILKNSLVNEGSTTTTLVSGFKGSKRRFSRSSFSSAMNEMNSTTGTINENVLNDICEQPKSHHLTSSLSTDAQYATLKVYEDLMHTRITTLFPHLDYLPRVSSARFSKSSMTTSSVCSKISSISSSVSVGSNGATKINNDEYRRLKVTHFIESAMKLIDAMDNFQRRKFNILKASNLTETKATTTSTTNANLNNFPVLGRVVNLSNVTASSLLEEEDIIETYLKWMDLWNKYLDEQALN